MKIGILTLPLHHNMGGILQNYALQKILEAMGHEVYTINRRRNEKISCRDRFISIAKRYLINILYNKKEIICILPTLKEEELLNAALNKFINQHIKLTELILRNEEFYLINKYKFDAYVVGSDQVWRLDYLPCYTNYYLDFVGAKENVKRIAYAASFGIEEWTYSQEQTKQCADLIKKFNAVSVREDTAIRLVEEHFECEAEHVLDPVFLLSQTDYLKLILPDKKQICRDGLFEYILDNNEFKNMVTHKISEKLHLDIFSILPKSNFVEVGRKGINSCVHPSISDWIQSFNDSQFVITDSFHGVVLSIIFNKQFLCIGNERRGLGRLTSLLKKFDLMDRLILESNDLSESLTSSLIDFKPVNLLLENERRVSISFLAKSLSL